MHSHDGFKDSSRCNWCLQCVIVIVCSAQRERRQYIIRNMEAYKKSHQTYIAKLCGTSHIPLADSFWLELIRHSRPLSAVCARSLQAFLRPFCEQFARNNSTTGHFTLLATQACDHVEAATKQFNVPCSEVLNATNAIVLLRGVSVELIRIIPPHLQQTCLLNSSSSTVEDDVFGRLLQTCVSYVETKKIETMNYALYYTILSFLLVCCSSSLYHDGHGAHLL